jgi:hypothetical protein
MMSSNDQSVMRLGKVEVARHLEGRRGEAANGVVAS